MKRIISIILSLAMLLSISGLVTIGAFAEDTKIIITTKEDFLKINDNLNGIYEIQANLDLTDVNFSIGTADAPFAGKIIGNLNGTGAKPTITMAKTGESNLGLVNYLGGAGEISNFKLKGAIEGATNVGAVAGYVNGNASISNIDNEVNLTTTTTSTTAINFGGIVGNINGSSNSSIANVTISNCSNFSAINIPSMNNIGGILGTSGNNSQVTIDNCKNYAAIKGYSLFAGIAGVLGEANYVNTITNCINYGDITPDSTSTTSKGSCGGILGKGTANIDSCYNLGNIAGYSSAGIVHRLINTKAKSVSVTNCFTTDGGDYTKSSADSSIGIVSIAETTNGGKVTIKNNYAKYSSTRTSIYPIWQTVRIRNGASGHSISIDISSNYYIDSLKATNPSVNSIDTTTTTDIYVPTSLTADQMKTEDAFDGFDFEGDDAVWTFKDGYDYPQLISNPYKEVVDIKDETITLNSTFNVKDDTYTVSWNEIEGATGYVVTVNGTTNNVTENSYTLNGDNNTYIVKVKAVSDTSETSEAEITVNTLFAGGDGESADTAYEIANARQFANIKETGFYKQIADIETITTPKATFNGTYDGNNKFIRVNLTGNTGYIALFSEVNAAKISDLTIKGTVTATEDASGAAALIGKATGATVTGCINEAPVNSASIKTGGFVAETATNSTGIFTITNSTNKGNVTYTGKSESNTGMGIGGIIGFGGIKNAANVINEGTVTGGAGNTGGIIGYSARTLTMSLCANKGKVISNGASVGGIAGRLANSGYHNIDKCYNSGPVTADGVAGGIVANSSMDLTLTNCFNTAKIIGTGYVGSIIGSFSEGSNQRTLTASNCYDVANPDKEIIGYIDATNLDASNLYILTEKDLTDYNGSPNAFTTENQAALSAVDGWFVLSGYEYPQLDGLEYEKVYYAVEIKVGNGGEIDTDNIIYVLKNEEVEVTVTPDSGYAVKDFTFNSAVMPSYIDKTEEFTFKTPAITDDALIEISFYELVVIPSVTNVTAYTPTLSLSEDLQGRVDDIEALKGKAGALAFTKVDIGAGYEISDYGMMLSESEDGYENGTKISAKAKGAYVYGILVYGKASGTQYYLTPYVCYGNNEVVYGTAQQVTFADFND